MGVLSLIGLGGITFFLPVVGLLPVVLLFSVMFLLNFFQSHYLNRITDSRQRATRVHGDPEREASKEGPEGHAGRTRRSHRRRQAAEAEAQSTKTRDEAATEAAVRLGGCTFRCFARGPLERDGENPCASLW